MRSILKFWLSCWLVTVASVTPSSVHAASPWMVQNFAGTGVKGFQDGPVATAQFNNPYGLTRGPDRALYVCDVDNHRIRRIDPDGVVTTVAGSGEKGYSGDGGPALRAALNEPYEVRFDRSGNMYFVERMNHLIRKVDGKTKLISTIAGTGKQGFSGDDGPAISAMLSQPHSIQFAPAGDLYICDILNHRLRRVEIASGQITTFSGTGEKSTTPDGVKIGGAALHGPRALDFDRAGNLWLALREGNAIYCLNLRSDTVQRRAGTGKAGFTGNGGRALEATLSGPKGLAVGSDGNIYIADTESHSIRMIDVARGSLELIAGTGKRGDGPEGPGESCEFARPHGIFADNDESIYIGDSENNRIRLLRKKRL